jgi:hypothetical protein
MKIEDDNEIETTPFEHAVETGEQQAEAIELLSGDESSDCEFERATDNLESIT